MIMNKFKYLPTYFVGGITTATLSRGDNIKFHFNLDIDGNQSSTYLPRSFQSAPYDARNNAIKSDVEEKTHILGDSTTKGAVEDKCEELTTFVNNIKCLDSDIVALTCCELPQNPDIKMLFTSMNVSPNTASMLIKFTQSVLMQNIIETASCRVVEKLSNSTDNRKNPLCGSNSQLQWYDLKTGRACPICLDLMAAPQMLIKCGHNICGGCLQLHYEACQSNNIDFCCPECRAPIIGHGNNRKLQEEYEKLVLSVEDSPEKRDWYLRLQDYHNHPMESNANNDLEDMALEKFISISIAIMAIVCLVCLSVKMKRSKV